MRPLFLSFLWADLGVRVTFLNFEMKVLKSKKSHLGRVIYAFPQATLVGSNKFYNVAFLLKLQIYPYDEGQPKKKNFFFKTGQTAGSQLFNFWLKCFNVYSFSCSNIFRINICI